MTDDPAASAASPLRRNLPLLAASFVNRCGSIGLSLLPVMLVDRHATTAQASTVMMSVRGVGIVAILFGGVLIDRVGTRAVILAAFALQCLGLGALPWAPSLALLTAAGAVSRVGEALFPAASRMTITASLPPDGARESIGWMRTANNAGSVVCYLLGALFPSAGVAVLMGFDSITAGLALALAAAAIPAAMSVRSRPAATDATAPARWGPAVWCVLANAAFVGVYELFLSGVAGLYRLRYGGHGVAVFSRVMLVNTVLCAATAVLAARWMRRVSVAMPVGAALLTVGAVLGASRDAPTSMLLVGGFVLSVGEIAFTAMAGYALLQTIPTARRQGTAYAAMLTVQDGGRVLGAALAFPWVVRGEHPGLALGVAGAVAVALAWKAGREVERLDAARTLARSVE